MAVMCMRCTFRGIKCVDIFQCAVENIDNVLMNKRFNLVVNFLPSFFTMKIIKNILFQPFGYDVWIKISRRK